MLLDNQGVMMKVSKCKDYDATKSKEENNKRVAENWRIEDIPWAKDNVIDLVTKHGISGNEFRGGERRTIKWRGTHMIMLDFDEGNMTKEWLLDLQKNWNHDSYVFSSQNHQRDKIGKDGKIKPACDRLRVLLPLKNVIDNEISRSAVDGWFIREYGDDLDASFMKATRYFAHGSEKVSSFVGGRGPLNWMVLPNLYGSNVARPKPSTFRLTDILQNGGGKSVVVKDVNPQTPIFCPTCGDAAFRSNSSHNAVLLENEDKIPFIFCSSCQSRKMGVAGKGVYNLHADDAFSLKAKANNAMVFIDTLTSTYYGRCIEPGIDEFAIRKLTSMEHVKEFRKSHKLPKPDTFPRARYELVFESDDLVSLKAGFVNKYQAPDVLTKPWPTGHKATLPKTIGLLLDHVIAGDQRIRDRFINDLAFFVQHRQKMITSYLFQGVEGTGKGLFFTSVLRPMFGSLYCSQTDQDAFGNQFNNFLTDNVLVLVNEVSGNFSGSDQKNLATIEKIKIAITDEHVQIEGKGQDRINGRNNCSFLFASNRLHAVVLSKNDRRFNVAPRQEQKIQSATWWPGYKQIRKMIESELQEFVWYLKRFKVDESLIGKVIDNAPKRLLQALSLTNAEDFFEAINKGNLGWLRDSLVRQDGYGSGEKHIEMQSLIKHFESAELVSTKDLCRLYNYINHKNLTVNAFGKMAAGLLAKPKSIRAGADVSWGIKVAWNEDVSDPSYTDLNEATDEKVA